MINDKTNLILRPNPVICHQDTSERFLFIRSAVLPANLITAQKFHASAPSRGPEVSSILEGSILGAASKDDLEETVRVLSIGRVHGFKNIQANEKMKFLRVLRYFFCFYFLLLTNTKDRVVNVDDILFICFEGYDIKLETLKCRSCNIR